MQPVRPVLKIVMTLQTVLADNVPVTRTIKQFISSFSERHVANVNVGRWNPFTRFNKLALPELGVAFSGRISPDLHRGWLFFAFMPMGMSPPSPYAHSDEDGQKQDLRDGEVRACEYVRRRVVQGMDSNDDKQVVCQDEDQRKKDSSLKQEPLVTPDVCRGFIVAKVDPMWNMPNAEYECRDQHSSKHSDCPIPL